MNTHILPSRHQFQFQFQAALSRAESAATAATGGTGDFNIGSELLSPRLIAARSKLNLEKAAEALARALPSCRTVNDLAKLEAALNAARKVGAHVLDPGTYATAKELRAQLDAASKARSALDAAVRSLQRQGRAEDVAEAEHTICTAQSFGELLAVDVAAARGAVAAFQAASAAENKLARALRDGSGASALSLAIKEAAGAGVQVTEARRILKLMHALESAVAAASSSSSEAPTARQSLQQ